MPQRKPRFLVDNMGKKIAVQLDIKQYEKILEDLEELEEIRAYDFAKASEEEAIPFERGIREIETERSRAMTSFPEARITPNEPTATSTVRVYQGCNPQSR